METMLNKKNFEAEVLQAELPVLVDFYADWCGPCRMLAPVLAEIAEEYAGRVKVCKVNVDNEAELAAAFRVESIPTLILFREGKAVDTSLGYRGKEQILAMLG